MAPDLNSLPPSSPPSLPAAASRSMHSPNSSTEASIAMGGESPPVASRSGSISLQAAATMNAGLQREPSRRSSSGSVSRNRQSPSAGRRRSVVLHNLQLNDPTIPSPGEMAHESTGAAGGHSSVSPQPIVGSPLMSGGSSHHRDRAPSLGELHQELEAEQEAQVNRLLQMIRQQQVQLQHLQASQGGQPPSTVAAEDGTPNSELPGSLPSQQAAPGPLSPYPPLPPSVELDPAISRHLAPSQLLRHQPVGKALPHATSSPRLRSTSISAEGGEPWLLGGGRDESAFYQAETQSLVRENQMLRHRIRELERQVSDSSHAHSSVTREPTHPSHLLHSTSISEDNSGAGGPSSVAVTEASTPAASTPKHD
ncbi:L-2-hydroxyglutarate oxidase LhgO [Apiospora marii]|uniref:L-2-hydroxyglutarate oxidase LhgO n=1 Tax=Apiospora marii TaxID=335849 RepID=A0ABR1SAK8_9PEZI